MTQNCDETLTQLCSSTTNYYLQDGLGMVTSLSSSASALCNTHANDSFRDLTGGWTSV